MESRLAANSARTYRMAPEGFATARKKMLVQRVVMFAGIALVVLAVQYNEFFGSWRQGSIASLLPALFVLVIIFFAAAIGMKRGDKHTQETWDSYELVIGEDFVIRRIKNFPEIEIQRHEVTAIKESRAGLLVETKVKGRSIGISSALVDYPDAKERLSGWMPIQSLQQHWMTPARWWWVLPLLTLSLFGILYMFDKSWVVLVTGVPLLMGTLVEYVVPSKKRARFHTNETRVSSHNTSTIGYHGEVDYCYSELALSASQADLCFALASATAVNTASSDGIKPNSTKTAA
jgi:hypothetical protein